MIKIHRCHGKHECYFGNIGSPHYLSEIGITQAQEMASFVSNQFATFDLFQMAAFTFLESTQSPRLINNPEVGQR